MNTNGTLQAVAEEENNNEPVPEGLGDRDDSDINISTEIDASADDVAAIYKKWLQLPVRGPLVRSYLQTLSYSIFISTLRLYSSRVSYFPSLLNPFTVA